MLTNDPGMGVIRHVDAGYEPGMPPAVDRRRPGACSKMPHERASRRYLSVRSLWHRRPIGRDPVTGGYLRYAWTRPELQLREWFRDQAQDRALAIEDDGNGNIFSWWGDPRSATPS